MRKTSLLLILGILAVVALGGYAGYLYWQKGVLTTDAKRVEKSFVQLQDEVVQYEGKNIDSAISAKQSISAIKAGIVQWSQVIRKIRSTIPKGDEGPLVNVVSYSGASGSEISMNVKTVAGSENPYLDIAKLIKGFDLSENFTSSFVSSISSGTDDEGYEILSFVFTTAYKERDEKAESYEVIDKATRVSEPLDAAVSDVLSEGLEEESVPKESVPR